jgi:c-di-GMP-binding flagellar brake protein YcgR
MNNRRSSSRLIQSSLVLLGDAEHLAREPEHYWTVDVSVGGLAVRAPDGSELEEDALVIVELPLGTSQSRIKTRCRVTRISEESELGRVAHLAFLDESPLFQRTLEAVMEDWIGRAESVDGRVQFRGEWW